MSQIRFYLDENVPTAVEVQLKRVEIDVVSARSLATLSDEDKSHLQRATEMQRVLCTHDTDFIELAKQFSDHHGIVWASHHQATVGGWVKALRQLHSESTAEAMGGQVRYINVK